MVSVPQIICPLSITERHTKKHLSSHLRKGSVVQLPAVGLLPGMNIPLSSPAQRGVMSMLESPLILRQSLECSSFLARLRSLLSIETVRDIVSWLPEGMIWRIHKVKAFVTSILPMFTEISLYEEFLILLKIQGFHEVSRGLDSIAFYHEVSPPS